MSKKLKILGTLSALFLVLSVCARSERWLSNRSSRTVTAETLARIPNVNPGDSLTKIAVTSCSSVSGDEFRLYDSSGVATSSIALNIQLSTRGATSASCQNEYLFDLRLSSSLTYTKQGTGEVVIIWQNDVLAPGD